MTIGEKIKQLRIERGLSVSEFAQQIEVTERTIYRWESNKNIPSNSYLAKIAISCDVKIEYFKSEKAKLSIVKLLAIISIVILSLLTLISLIGFIAYLATGQRVLFGLSFDFIIAMLIFSFSLLSFAIVFLSLNKY